VTAYALGSGSIMYAPFGLYRAIQFDYSATNWQGWLSVLYLAIGVSVVAYTIYYWILKQISAVRLAVFSNIQPVIATIVAILLLGEQPGLSFYLGGAIVLTGVIITEV
jgi:drug/metabolite transporter (DMT)-like permease